jgi:zinc/manganese transport system substrate-binding protein
MRFLGIIIINLLLMGSSLAALKVVTSFSILQDIVKQIGGEYVELDNIVGPNEDAHVFNPAPQHSMMLAKADLVIINGLGFEGWIERLINASGYKGKIVSASGNVKALKVTNVPGQTAFGMTDDPHAWHSVPAVMKYVDNISAALQKADPKNANHYKRKATSYKQRLKYLDDWIRDELSKVDPKKRKIITAHDAFQYFAHEYGVQFLSPVGVSTQAEASPDAVMQLIKLIRKEEIKMIFIENITNEKQMNMIRESTGARIGGTLYSDALSSSDGPGSDYLSLMRHNVSLITAAMK